MHARLSACYAIAKHVPSMQPCNMPPVLTINMAMHLHSTGLPFACTSPRYDVCAATSTSGPSIR